MFFMSIFEDSDPKQYWDKQKPTFDKIFSTSFQEFSETLPIETAFHMADRSLRCIGEGTVSGIHLAGSGILLGEEETLKFIQEARVDGVYSHSGCGAVRSIVEKSGKNKKDTDKYAEEWAEKIAEKSGIPFLGHIGLMELKRPPTFHIARVIYYDGTADLITHR